MPMSSSRRTMAAECPGVKLSVAPNPQEFSYRNYLADWSDWVGRGLVDEVVVQIYRWNRRGVEAELAHPSLARARAKVPVRIGLLAGLRGRLKGGELLRRELDLVGAGGLDGVDLFFYETAKLHFRGRRAPGREVFSGPAMTILPLTVAPPGPPAASSW